MQCEDASRIYNTKEHAAPQVAVAQIHRLLLPAVGDAETLAIGAVDEQVVVMIFWMQMHLKINDAAFCERLPHAGGCRRSAEAHAGSDAKMRQRLANVEPGEGVAGAAEMFTGTCARPNISAATWSNTRAGSSAGSPLSASTRLVIAVGPQCLT